MAELSRTFNIRLPGGRILKAKESEILSDVLRRAGYPLLAVCQGRGTCGKCLVEITKGRLPPRGDREAHLLEQKKLSSSFRMACQFRIKGDLDIRIPRQSVFQETKILKKGTHVPFVFSPPAQRLFLSLPESSVSDPISFQERLEKSLGRRIHLSIHIIRGLDEKTLRADALWVIVDHEGRIIDIALEDAPRGHFGIAVDIGTTTVVMALADFESGIVDHSMAMNRQAYYGSDVVSRLTYAFSDPAGLSHLNRKIIQTLNHMVQELCERNHIDAERITQMTVACNTAMNHFLFSAPTGTLAVAPFHAVFQKPGEFRAHDIGVRIHPEGGVYTAPNIRSFVGGDISAGLLATGLFEREGNYLFVDLGTNGEIVLKKGKRMIATSTAAGPAFEGATISQGSMAVPGAICGAEWKQGLVCHTIDNEPPAGICGTGLLDLVGIFLERGDLGPSGEIQNKSKILSVTDTISITQRDIRELQMAIAAVKTGIRLLLRRFGIGPADLDGLFVAGAFGNELNIDCTRKIGLLPPLMDSKIFFVGNASLAGAVMSLLSVTERRKLEKNTRRIRFVSLASDPLFQDTFIDAFRFGEGFFGDD